MIKIADAGWSEFEQDYPQTLATPENQEDSHQTPAHVLALETSKLEGVINTVNIIGAQSINPTFDAYFLKEKYGSPAKLASSVRRSVISTYGYLLLAASGAVIAFEQLPTNEDWRIRAGTKTLIETGSPVEVAKTVFEITMKIELGSCAVVMAALYSGNPLITRARKGFSEWREGGLERAKYRKELKLDKNEEKIKEKNIKRIEKGKEPNRLSKREKSRTDSKVKENIQETSTDILVSLGIGAAITTLLRGVSGKDRRVARSILTSASYSTFLALFSGALGYIVASGKEINFEIPLIDKTVDISNILVDYGTDSKWILTALLVAYSPSTMKKLYGRTGKREENFQSWLTHKKGQQPEHTTDLPSV
jgi:hypothetical protein